MIATGWLALALYCYPGFMSFDSFEALAQARDLMPMSDWHPPILALTWRPLDAVLPGPWLVVMLQSGLLLGGIYAVLARTLRPLGAALVTLAIGLWPPVLTLMAVVWKDSLMAGVLVASYAALTSTHPRARIAALAGLLYAALLRHNAIVAIAPLLILLSPWPARRGRWTQRAIGLALAFAVLLSAQLINRMLIETRTYPFVHSIPTYDIAGTLRYAAPLSDEQIAELLPGVPLVVQTGIQARAKSAWVPEGWFSVAIGEGRLMDRPATAAQRDAVLSAWLRLIREHPGPYLRARLRVFRELIGLPLRERPRWHIYNAIAEDHALLAGYGIDFERPPWQLRWSFWFADVSRSALIFRAWPYLLVAIALAITLRRNRGAIAIVASGLCYETALFVIAPSADFRYSTWLVISTLIGFALRFSQRVETRAGSNSCSSSANRATPSPSVGANVCIYVTNPTRDEFVLEGRRATEHKYAP
ncbi:MAG TPA: hypothetical protein VIV11_37270 [Kofleriaceae bacterium]